MLRPPISISRHKRTPCNSLYTSVRTCFVLGDVPLIDRGADLNNPNLPSMASGIVNIRRDVDDKFYRYRYVSAVGMSANCG